MTVTFVTHDESGDRIYTGHVVSRGPSSIVLLLTEPFPVAGRTVSFPMASVVAEVQAA